VRHLEPTGETVKVSAGASHDVVAKALGMAAREQKSRKPAAKPAKNTARAAPAVKPAAKAKVAKK
jgi:hypothetical protein